MALIPDAEAVFARVADRPGSAWLDGGAAPTGWSILAWDPEDVVTDGARWPDVGRSRVRGAGHAGDSPFGGGVIGFVGFGAGHRVAPVPAERASPEPEVLLARYAGGLCLRHADHTWHAAGSPGFVADALRLVTDVAGAPALPPPVLATGSATTVERGAWEASVGAILALLRAGDCYQVNLTRPVWVADVGPAFDAYRRLRRSDAAYGAFLRLDPNVAVLSNSPELLLEVRGRRARSVPIKGTRPRGADPADDARLERELRDSPKERAELTMIVDLVRNDLGRIAAVGSVAAGERTLDAHPTVHHASWPVSAELGPGVDAWDALAALFPPGSVTGAPKVRACERIAELEPHPRGVYCGAIGYVADGGDAAWSVAIRTAVVDGADARYHVGGGIVADSAPAAEWDETVAKETALRRALVVR